MTDIYRAHGCVFNGLNDVVIRNDREAPFEPETMEFINTALSHRDGCFIDVGASTGWYSCIMAKRGHDVIAFEPNRNAMKRLRENMNRNRLFIHCFEAAASNDKGRGILHHNKNELLTSGGSLNGVHCANPGAYHVDKMRIDDAVNIPVAVIKIDVEGYELRVLQGAEKTIMKNKPRMILEANSQADESILATWLIDHYYSYCRIDGRNLACVPCA